MRCLDRKPLAQARHLPECARRDDETLAIREALVIGSDNEPHDPIQDKRDAKTDDHEDHRLGLLFAVKAVNHTVGGQQQAHPPRMPKGRASSAVGNGPSEMPQLWNNHVNSTVTMAPKAIVSPCAKFENRRMP